LRRIGRLDRVPPRVTRQPLKYKATYGKWFRKAARPKAVKRALSTYRRTIGHKLGHRIRFDTFPLFFGGRALVS